MLSLEREAPCARPRMTRKKEFTRNFGNLIECRVSKERTKIMYMLQQSTSDRMYSQTVKAKASEILRVHVAAMIISRSPTSERRGNLREINHN